jgi:hypothetical protein
VSILALGSKFLKTAVILKGERSMVDRRKTSFAGLRLPFQVAPVMRAVRYIPGTYRAERGLSASLIKEVANAGGYAACFYGCWAGGGDAVKCGDNCGNIWFGHPVA